MASETAGEAPEAYRAFLGRLYSRQRLGIKMGLGNMQRLLAALGEPQRDLSPVLVGGTNGKGTVSLLLHRLLAASGEPTGLYLSPHVERFTERIAGPRGEIGPVGLVRLGDEVLSACDRLDALGTRPTFFEATTALALLWFAKERLTRPVLEVGLGGRLDATNACGALLGGVTNVGSDHAELLGPTVRERAREKFSIVEPGGKLLTTEHQAQALGSGREATAVRGVRMRELASRGLRVEAEGPARWRVHFALEERAQDLPVRSLLAPHAANLQLAAALWEEATGCVLGPRERQLLSATPPLPVRREAFHLHGVTVILDGGHNREALASLSDALGAVDLPHPRVLVAGLMRDKDPTALAPLVGWADRVHVTRAQSGRAMEPASLAGLLSAHAMHRDVADAMAAAVGEAATDGTTVVCGSMFLAGEARTWLRTGRADTEIPAEVRLQ